MGKAIPGDGRIISGRFASDHRRVLRHRVLRYRALWHKILCKVSRFFYIKKIISVTIKNATAVRAGCFSQFLGHFFSIIRMAAENIR